MYTSIPAAILNHADRNPEKIAVVAGNQKLSYGELLEEAQKASGRLLDLGVLRGDRIVLSASVATPSFVIGYLAVHSMGCAVVPVDNQISTNGLAYIVRKVKPAAVFLPKPNTIENGQIYSIDELNEVKGTREVPVRAPDPDVTADIIFTTGTTGDPKGVVLTHENICNTAANINKFIRNNSEDREVVPLPLSHSFGLGRLRCNLLLGSTIILVDGFKFPGMIFRAIETWGATGLASVPTGISLLFNTAGDRLGQYEDQIRYLEIGSAPMPIEDKRRLMKLLPNARLCMHYGLTEASRSTFIEFHEAAEKLNSIGLATPGVTVKIVDENGSELPTNTLGRIVVRGKHVMQRYWKEPKITNEVLKSEWLYTGDWGYRDDDGYFYLKGREKELINVGGRKVSPVEIEAILEKHVAISQCVCVGIPDPRGIAGDVVKAFIVLNGDVAKSPGNHELVDFLRDKLEPYKLPAEFQTIDEIPMTKSGKIQRSLLPKH